MTAGEATPRELLARELVLLVLLLGLTAVAVLPTNSAALTSVLVCVGAAVATPVLRAQRGRPDLARPTVALLAALAVPVAFGLGAALAAVNPTVALVGQVGQHVGALTWAAILSVVIGLVVRPQAGDVGRTARAIAVAGAVVALAALLDAAGIWSPARFSAEPGGILENSLSVAQVLTVALGGAGGWAWARRGRERWVALACAATCAVGLVVSDSRAAWLGVVVGLAVACVAVWAVRRPSVTPRLLAAVAAGALVVGGVALWIVATNDAGGPQATLSALSNGRTTVWSSAVARSAESPLIGFGPEQFSAWVTWDSQPGVSLSKTATYDPHNVLLWWLLAAGWPAVVAVLVATALGLERLFAALAATRGSAAVATMVAGLLAWAVSLLFAWVSPLAALMAGMLFAGLVAAADRKSEAPRLGVRAVSVTSALLTAGVALLVMTLFLSGGIAAEYRWGAAIDRGAIDSATAVEIARTSEDPTLSALAVTSLMREMLQQPERAAELFVQAESLEPVLERDSVWHVDAAFERYQLATARVSILGDEEAWREAEFAIQAGKQADANTGFWDYAAALQAAEFGFEESALTHAAAALEYDVPSEARLFLEEILGSNTEAP